MSFAHLPKFLQSFSLVRTPVMILLAGFINLLLFFLIQQMVTGDHTALKKITDVNLIDFIRVKQEKKLTEPIDEEMIIEESKPPDDVPPPPELAQPEISKPVAMEMDLPVPELDLPLSLHGTPYLGDFKKSVKAKPRTRVKPVKPKIDTNVVPTIKIPPVYPPRALRTGIEGVITVEFTITTDGSVKDPEIVKAKPPKIFDRAVLQAIKKWKFNPEMVDGKAVEKRARQDVRFTLKR